LHEAWQTPEPTHGVRTPCGAPLSTVEHVPTEPETSQAWHCPPHAVLQHTPSTQWPLPHAAFELHVAPFGSEQVPVPFALQTCGAAHEPAEQQTPSTQLPLAQSVPSAQAVPSAPVVTQTLLMHV
jgi:hypothetical protein